MGDHQTLQLSEMILTLTSSCLEESAGFKSRVLYYETLQCRRAHSQPEISEAGFEAVLTQG